MRFSVRSRSTSESQERGIQSVELTVFDPPFPDAVRLGESAIRMEAFAPDNYGVSRQSRVIN